MAGDIYDALMEAIRAFRDDEHLAKTAPGSAARRERIQQIIKPIADHYDMKPGELGRAIARALSA